jgi:hypothetical protein
MFPSTDLVFEIIFDRCKGTDKHRVEFEYLSTSLSYVLKDRFPFCQPHPTYRILSTVVLKLLFIPTVKSNCNRMT